MTDDSSDDTILTMHATIKGAPHFLRHTANALTVCANFEPESEVMSFAAQGDNCPYFQTRKHPDHGSSHPAERVDVKTKCSGGLHNGWLENKEFHSRKERDARKGAVAGVRCPTLIMRPLEKRDNSGTLQFESTIITGDGEFFTVRKYEIKVDANTGKIVMQETVSIA